MSTASASPECRFAIAAPSRSAYLTLAALAALAALLPVLSPALSSTPAVAHWRHAAVMLPLVLGIGGLLLWAIQRRSVQLADGVLTVKAGLYTRRIACSDLDLAHSRVVSLDERPELRPLLRTNGIGLPGFAAGHYRLRDRSKAFLLVTDWQRVLALRERNGRVLLLSLVRPQALLDTLRAAN